jgi:hypothetical protein
MEAGRVPFEQESLGRPDLAHWPFYAQAALAKNPLSPSAAPFV